MSSLGHYRRSCDRCHGQKLRCSRENGRESCTRCLRADVPCQVSAPKRSRARHSTPRINAPVRPPATEATEAGLPGEPNRPGNSSGDDSVHALANYHGLGLPADRHLELLQQHAADPFSAWQNGMMDLPPGLSLDEPMLSSSDLGFDLGEGPPWGADGLVGGRANDGMATPTSGNGAGRTVPSSSTTPGHASAVEKGSPVEQHQTSQTSQSNIPSPLELPQLGDKTTKDANLGCGDGRSDASGSACLGARGLQIQQTRSVREPHEYRQRGTTAISDEPAEEDMAGFVRQLSSINVDLYVASSTIPPLDVWERQQDNTPFPHKEQALDQMFRLTQLFTELLSKMRRSREVGLERAGPAAGVSDRGVSDDGQSPPEPRQRPGLDHSICLLIFSSYMRIVEAYSTIFEHIAICAKRKLALSAPPRPGPGDDLDLPSLPSIAIGAFTMRPSSGMQVLLMIHLMEIMMTRSHDLVASMLPASALERAQHRPELRGRPGDTPSPSVTEANGPEWAEDASFEAAGEWSALALAATLRGFRPKEEAALEAIRSLRRILGAGQYIGLE